MRRWIIVHSNCSQIHWPVHCRGVGPLVEKQIDSVFMIKVNMVDVGVIKAHKCVIELLISDVVCSDAVFSSCDCW